MLIFLSQRHTHNAENGLGRGAKPPNRPVNFYI